MEPSERFVAVPWARLTLGVSTWHLAATIGVLTVLLYSVVVSLMVVAMLAAGNLLDIAIVLRVMPVTAAVVGFSFLLLLLGSKISRALYGNRSDRRAGVQSTPAWRLCRSFRCWSFRFIGDLGCPCRTRRFVLACAIAPATPVLLILMSRVAAEENRCDEKWERLLIES